MVYENIRNLREDRDLTQKYIAKTLHISQSNYSKKENGQREFTASDLVILSKFYGVTTDYLLGLQKHT